MRLHPQCTAIHPGPGLFRVLTLGAVVAIILGGVFVYDGIHNAPKAVIHRLTIRDHQRSQRFSKTQRPSSTSHHVPWNPTLPNEVATIAIPALDVTAPILPENPTNGLLPIPGDVHHVGWDDQTPPPGHQGITLLAGHVNWVGQGEGALGEIGQLVPGDTVILNWNGIQTTWRITTKPVLSPNTMAHSWLFSNHGAPTLALVTCGGPFTEIPGVGGSYADNVILEAKPVTT